MTFPIPIEPKYNPANLNSKRAASDWRVAHQLANPCGGWITQAGDVLLTNADPQGQWRDADALHPVPPEWRHAYPDIPEPQYWAPQFPDLPNNLIYEYVTVWGRSGIDLFVLSADAKTALSAAQQTLVDPPPYSAPQPRFMQFWQRIRNFF